MPVSRGRKKKHNVSGMDLSPASPLSSGGENTANPSWLMPVMLGLMILGLLWIVTFYLTAGTYRLPIPGIGNWNLAIGFALILAGFGLTTQWK
jgi:hypothetical protein